VSGQLEQRGRKLHCARVIIHDENICHLSFDPAGLVRTTSRSFTRDLAANRSRIVKQRKFQAARALSLVVARPQAQPRHDRVMMHGVMSGPMFCARRQAPEVVDSGWSVHEVRARVVALRGEEGDAVSLFLRPNEM